MDFQLENLIINDVDLGLESSIIPFKLSFEITRDGKKMGSCQLSIVNLLNQVQLEDVHKNDFVFKPYVERKKGGKGKPECDICGKTFWDSHKVRKHKNAVHLGIKPFKCNVCGKAFADNDLLKGHKQTHQKDKRHKCNECGKSFVARIRLQSHIDIVHKDLIPFQCQECGRAYSTKYDLNRHVNVVHKGVKVYECEECGERFGTKWEINKHVKNHQEKRPATHSQSSVLKDSSTSNTTTKFDCNVCGAYFVRKIELDKHRRSHEEEHQPNTQEQIEESLNMEQISSSN